MSRGNVLLVGVWLLAATAASAQTLTEAEAVRRMRAEHPRVQALRLSVRESEATARLRTVPVNPTVSYTREDAGPTVDEFFVVSQDLPLWGHRRRLREVAGRAVAAADATADAALFAVETDLRLVFTDLLAAQARIGSLETAVDTLRALVRVVRAREAQGEGSRFDRLRVEREQADVETDLAVAQIGRRLAQARLAAFFRAGTDPETLSAAGSLAALSGLASPVALDQRADYRALSLETARWAAERRAAERLRLPGATVTGGLKRTDSSGVADTGYALTALINVPLFDRGEAQLVRADAARARAEAERQALAASIAADVDAARAAAIRYGDLADQYRADSVERATELVGIATAAYEEGVYGILELLDAHRVTLRARLRLLDLSAAARRAAIDLDGALGREVTP